MKYPALEGFPLSLPESRRVSARSGGCPQCGYGLTERDYCRNCGYDAFDDASEPLGAQDLGCGVLVLLLMLLGLFCLK